MTKLARNASEQALHDEIARLNKIVQALMDRAELNMQPQNSEFGIFRYNLLFDRQLHLRTTELENAFRENQRVFQALQESESRFRGLATQSLVGIVIIEDLRCTYVNPRLAAIFGRTVAEMLHHPIVDFLPPHEIDRVPSRILKRLREETPSSPFQFQVRRPDGSLLELEAHSSVMELHGKRSVISMVLDITDRIAEQRRIQALQEQLRQQAIHDSLTGLYNRLPLAEFFDREIQLSTRSGRPLSVVMADIDHFKRVNDTYGHQAGDDALRTLASLIRNACRKTDLCCRFGGEEILLLLPDMPLDQAVGRIEKIRALIENTPIASGAHAFHITLSFGIAAFPAHGHTRDQLIAAADRALYAAKNSGRNRIHLYAPALENTLS